MPHPTPRSRLIFAVLFALFALPVHADREAVSADPWQPMNRRVYAFNEQLDRYLLYPVARVYESVPLPVRRSVGNFFDNLGEPYTVINDILQGKPGKALRDTGRFVINTTIGIVGLFDPATDLGFPREPEDFGQTLAVWRVPSGPYLVLPLLGPSSVRDAIGRVPVWVGGDPVVRRIHEHELWYAQGLEVVDNRSRLLDLDAVLKQQPDAYLFVREAYLEHRIRRVNDSVGNTHGSDLDDEFLDLLDEE